MVYNIVPLFNCRLVMHTYNTKVFHDTHTLKSSFETYKNALKNMYIDIFICIQIGPSQQKQTHIPFICLSFAKGGFLQRLTSTQRVQLMCSRTPYIKVESPGRENHQLPNTSTDRKEKNKEHSHNLSAFQNKIQEKSSSRPQTLRGEVSKLWKHYRRITARTQ